MITHNKIQKVFRIVMTGKTKAWFLLGVFSLYPVVAQGYCADTLLAAIAARETPGGWDGRPGPAGERSVYAITPAVWRQHMGARPLREAWNILDARECARRHLAWLDAGLRRHGYEPTPERLALAWNVGLAGALRRGLRVNPYAEQVANLYTEAVQTRIPENDND